jgi:hypothetical protein
LSERHGDSVKGGREEEVSAKSLRGSEERVSFLSC